jgi:diacylglycerol O-acyltransferase
MRPRPQDIAFHAEPDLRVGALLHFTGTPPTVERLRSHAVACADAIPAWRVTIDVGGRRPRWSELPADFDQQVRERTLAPGAEPRAAALEVNEVPFASGTPAWDLTLLRGYAPDGYAIFYRCGHGLQDGGGIVRTLDILLGQSQETPQRPVGVARGLSSPRAPRLVHLARAAAGMTRAARSPGPWPSLGIAYSPARNHRWADVPFDLVRAVGRSRGGTAHDAFLAALADPLHRWVARYGLGTDTGGLHVYVAVNVRKPEEADLPGNFLAPTGVPLPAPAPGRDPVRAVAHSTAQLRCPGHRAALRDIVRHSPPAVERAAVRWMTSPRRAGVLTSFVAPQHRPLGLFGDPVEAIDPFTVLPEGFPVSVLLAVYLDRATAAFVTDAALPGMDVLHELWRDALYRLAPADAGPPVTDSPNA